MTPQDEIILFVHRAGSYMNMASMAYERGEWGNAAYYYALAEAAVRGAKEAAAFLSKEAA